MFLWTFCSAARMSLSIVHPPATHTVVMHKEDQSRAASRRSAAFVTWRVPAAHQRVLSVSASLQIRVF